MQHNPKCTDAVNSSVLHDVDHEGVRGPVRAVYPPGRAALRRLQEQLLLLPRDREPNEARRHGIAIRRLGGRNAVLDLRRAGEVLLRRGPAVVGRDGAVVGGVQGTVKVRWRLNLITSTAAVVTDCEKV